MRPHRNDECNNNGDYGAIELPAAQSRKKHVDCRGLPFYATIRGLTTGTI